MAAVQPERILRDLADLWVSLAQPAQGASTASGVLRACSMTLIVAAKDARDAETIGETIGQLMHEHPSRTIVLKPAPEGAELASRVYAQCWMPFGSRQQICCEQIEITAPAGQVDQAARVILGLPAPDLPAVLWARGTGWFERAGFDDLYPLIEKIVLDSCEFDDSAFELATIRKLRERPLPRVADLAWARLTLWRETIFHTLEAVSRGKPVQTIEIGHYGESPSTSCYYMAAWLAGAFPAADVAFRRVPGEEGRIASVALRDGDFSIVFERVEGDTVRISGAVQNVVVLPHATDYRAMREELSLPAGDPAFDAVWTKAEQLRARPER